MSILNHQALDMHTDNADRPKALIEGIAPRRVEHPMRNVAPEVREILCVPMFLLVEDDLEPPIISSAGGGCERART